MKGQGFTLALNAGDVSRDPVDRYADDHLSHTSLGLDPLHLPNGPNDVREPCKRLGSARSESRGLLGQPLRTLSERQYAGPLEGTGRAPVGSEIRLIG